MLDRARCSDLWSSPNPNPLNRASLTGSNDPGGLHAMRELQVKEEAGLKSTEPD